MNINCLTIKPDARIRNLQSKVKYRWYSLDVFAATLVHRTNETNVFRLYYYEKHEPPFVFVLQTNMAVLSRD